MLSVLKNLVSDTDRNVIGTSRHVAVHESGIGPITSFGQDVEFGRYRGHSGHAPIAAGLDGVANDPTAIATRPVNKKPRTIPGL